MLIPAGGISRFPASSTRNVIQSMSAATVPLTVTGATGQTADVFKVQDVSGNNLFRVLPPGQGARVKMIGEAAGTDELFSFQNFAGDFLYSFFGDGSTFHQMRTSATNTATRIVTWNHNSTGTPAAGFGQNTRWRLKSSTTDDRTVAINYITWVVATDASRTARVVHTVYDTAEREAFRIEANGSAAMIGFLGAAAIARPTAYTQTYATATRTHNNVTSAAVATTAATQTTPWGYGSQAQADAIPVAINAVAADLLNLKQLVNSLIDDGQSFGLLQ